MAYTICPECGQVLSPQESQAEYCNNCGEDFSYDDFDEDDWREEMEERRQEDFAKGCNLLTKSSKFIQMSNRKTKAEKVADASLLQNCLLPAVPYQLCPKCNGQGTVSKPSYVPGDVSQWSSSSSVFQCDVCVGAKIIPMFIVEQKVEKA